MRFTLLPVAVLATVGQMASAFAPAAGFNVAKMGAPAVALPRASSMSARRPARLLELKATAALAPETFKGATREETDYTVPEWRKKVDLPTWAKEVRAVEKKYRTQQNDDDVNHMKKMLNWTYILYAVGLATAGFATFPFNPISALCLSTAICMRWTMIGHHVGHGGYNAQVFPHISIARSLSLALSISCSLFFLFVCLKEFLMLERISQNIFSL